jgi:hypothetical protein
MGRIDYFHDPRGPAANSMGAVGDADRDNGFTKRMLWSDRIRTGHYRGM